MSVAKHYLKDEDLPEELREPINMHMVMVHISVQQYSKDFEQQLKRRNFSTPKNYLDFLQNYSRLLTDNRQKYTDMVTRYQNGLKKLAEASEQVKELQQELVIKQTEVNAEKKEVEELLSEIKTKTDIAKTAETEAKDKKAQLDIDNVEIARQQKEADEILKAAIPLLEEAQVALSIIDQKELVFLKALPNPPKPVMSVAQCLLILKPTESEDEKDGWAGAKILLNNPQKLLNDLKGYGDKISKVTKNQIEKVRNIMNNPENRLDDIQSVSKAAANLLTWVKSTNNLYDVNKKVEPLKNKLEQMNKKSAQLKEELAATKAQLETLQKDLAELDDNRQKKQARLDDLTHQANLMERRLNAAKKLINGLQREKDRTACASKSSRSSCWATACCAAPSSRTSGRSTSSSGTG